MGHKKIEVQQWICDGCGKGFYGEPGLNFLGIQGNVNEHGPTGGWGGEWFACKRSCIRKAIITVLDKVDWE